MSTAKVLLYQFDRLQYDVAQLLECQRMLDHTSQSRYEWDRKVLDDARYNYDGTLRVISHLLKELDK